MVEEKPQSETAEKPEEELSSPTSLAPLVVQQEADPLNTPKISTPSVSGLPPLPPPLPASLLSPSNPATTPSTPANTAPQTSFFRGPQPLADGSLPPPPPPPAHAVLARMSMAQANGASLPLTTNGIAPGAPVVATMSSTSSSHVDGGSPSTSTTPGHLRKPSNVTVSPNGSHPSSLTPTTTSPLVRGNSIRGRVRGGNNTSAGNGILNTFGSDTSRVDPNRRSPSPTHRNATSSHTAHSTEADDMIDDKEIAEYEREMAGAYVTESFPDLMTPVTRNASATFCIPRAPAALVTVTSTTTSPSADHDSVTSASSVSPLSASVVSSSSTSTSTSVVVPEAMNLSLTSKDQAAGDSDRIFRMLRAQANAARTALERQQRDGTSLTASAAMGPAEEEPYNPAYAMPTFFTSTPAKALPEAMARNVNHVFCLGPVSYASERKKQWKPRWAVLYRDRLELFTKFSDPQPRMVIALEGMTVSTSADHTSPGGYSVSLAKSKAERIFLRGDPQSFYQSCALPLGQNPLGVPVPDVATLHRAWSVAIRMRAENIEYIKKSRLQSMVPDERVMNQFDMQVRSPAVRHILEYYNPGAMFPISLPNYRADSVLPAPRHWTTPPSGLCVEVTALDLCGGSMTIDSASSLAKLFLEPDCVPTVALRFGGIHMETMHLDIFLNACSRHPASPLVELDFVYVDVASADCRDFFIRLFVDMNLPQLRHIGLRDSNLNDEFVSFWSKGIRSRSAKQTPNQGARIRLQTLDLSMNDISDTGALSFIEMLTESATLTSDLQAISFALNPVSDATAVKLAKWIATQRPAPGQKSTLFTHAMGRTIALQHISLAHSNVTSKGARAFADAACWSLTLRSLDLSGCSAVNEEGIAALSHLGQINESLDYLFFGSYRLGVQGLTAMRLFYRYALADPAIFGDSSKKHFSQAALACEYTSLSGEFQAPVSAPGV